MSAYILIGIGCFIGGYMLSPFITTVGKIFKGAWIEYCREKYEQSKLKKDE